MAHQKNSEIFHEHQYLAKIFHDPFKISPFPLRPPSPIHTHTHTHTHHYILHVLALITFLKVQPFYDFFLLLIFTFLKNIFINEPESHKVLPIFMISSNFHLILLIFLFSCIAGVSHRVVGAKGVQNQKCFYEILRLLLMVMLLIKMISKHI